MVQQKNSGGESSSDVPVHVYEPHKAGLPPLKRYFSDLWDRRFFAAASSRANIRAANTRTFFGQLWLVFNPLLLALVYFFLVVVLRGSSSGDFSLAGGIELLAHITGGLFLFFLISGALQAGASSVTGGGKLILNISFPRLLLPLGAVRTAFFRFLPTVPVYFLLRTVAGEPWRWEMLWAAYFLLTAVGFAIGLAALLATLQVYFRDASSFLPYFTRIWLYLSPILWYPADVYPVVGDWLYLNPLYSIIGGWTETSLSGVVPPIEMFIFAGVWSLVAAVTGTLFFMSRERDFAVRL